VRRLAFLLVAALALTACGASKHTSTTGNTDAAQAQIKSAYETFFAGKTSVADRVALLQNGSKFKAVVASFASNPLAKTAKAKVDSVTLVGPNKAQVAYSVKISGASLATQLGFAVRQNGTWKVGDASICRLIALQGTTPAVCKNSTS
jgi:hypothetical protein